MAFDSTRDRILQAICDRLKTMTAANFYELDVKRVFYDQIPLGMQLEAHEMPAVLMLDAGAEYQHEHQKLNVALKVRLHLILEEGSTDKSVNFFIRQIGKAVWANHPAAEVTDQFRSIDPRIYQIVWDLDETDLNMIPANRIATAQMIVHYRTAPYDL